VRDKNAWIAVAQAASRRQGFFHWELDFATVFASGGFDVQLGNPPWVRPRTDVEALLAEGDPWWQLTEKASEALKADRLQTVLRVTGIRSLVLENSGDTMSLASILSDGSVFPLLSGQPDLYRAFMSQTWTHQSPNGVVGLIHLESHFTDEKAHRLRTDAYRRLRRHWHFYNELRLFEIQNQKQFGVNIYAAARTPEFLHATGLFHPDTVLRSFSHDGSGVAPGIKDEQGGWNVRAHALRIQCVNEETLALWNELVGGEPRKSASASMVSITTRDLTNALEVMAKSPRIGSMPVHYARGWDQSIDRKKGYFGDEWGRRRWEDAILQGSHMFVGNPFYKWPNESMKSQRDWFQIDLEAIDADETPICSFALIGTDSSRSYFRVSWRRQIDNSGERTLISALLPPGPAHVNTVNSLGGPDLPLEALAGISAVLSSLLADFSVRAVPKNDCLPPTIRRLPAPPMGHPLYRALLLRTLRLNCMTSEFGALWGELWGPDFSDDSWTQKSDLLDRHEIALVRPFWSMDVPIRIDAVRRQALVEIDALVALCFGVTIDALVSVYRTQFPALVGKDTGRAATKFIYDANGRLVPNSVLTVWRKKGDAITEDERKAVHPGSGVEYTYELPFGTLDREADMRTAYAEFERRLAEKTKDA
jgi:hypothetical protein